MKVCCPTTPSTCLYIYIYIYIWWEEIIQKLQSITQTEELQQNNVCSNTLPLLIKLENLIKTSVLVYTQVRPIQSWDVYDTSKILMRLRTFWTSLLCMCVCVCVCVCVYNYGEDLKLKSWQNNIKIYFKCNKYIRCKTG